jgi:hypothetical protein
MRQCPCSIKEVDYGVSGAQLLDTCSGFPSQVTEVELSLTWMVGYRSSKATEGGRSQEQVEDQEQSLGYGERERSRPRL